MEALASETSDGRRDQIRDALKSYCRRDTEALVLILQSLTVANSAVPSPLPNSAMQ
jgi:hypothetical protein